MKVGDREGVADKTYTILPLFFFPYPPPPPPPPLAWQQHDVQELCRVMFDALEKRLRKDAHEHPELINELYQGDMKDYVKCLEVREGEGEGGREGEGGINHAQQVIIHFVIISV